MPLTLNLARKRRIHFVGIGGIGMSGIAQVMLRRGHSVSGSDVGDSPMLRRLRKLGARGYEGHSARHVQGAQLVVYSSSITPQNPELREARNRGIPVRSRAQMLAECMRGKIGIAVTGSHGKTTTTSLIASALLSSDRDPTILVGAEVERFGGNARVGKGRIVVVEADESDGSFVYLPARIGVITNIDEEHLDYYRNFNEILSSYRQFVQRIDPKGSLICNGDDPGVRRLLRDVARPTMTYGIDPLCDVTARDAQAEGRRTQYNACARGKRLGKITLRIPGMHNVVNSLAAVAAGLKLGLAFSDVQKALQSYEGAGRRFQTQGEVDGVLVVEDYAHHPAEIEATLQAARTWGEYRRIFCVFQPHRFSRTKYLRNRFGTCFSAADHLILTDVYAASEDPQEGAGVEFLSAAVGQSGHASFEVMPREKIVPALTQAVRLGDLVLILGAGDIGDVARELVAALRAQRSAHQAVAC
ncbi:MAG: UDP-N-acetylmuramate--L-alanine ligase [Candidatus Omnitrophica bacterium]|nr:UDP-N-acetylmuramate--L-alanine ligase [Candidatus Omnitrophota bacterium]